MGKSSCGKRVRGGDTQVACEETVDIKSTKDEVKSEVQSTECAVFNQMSAEEETTGVLGGEKVVAQESDKGKNEGAAECRMELDVPNTNCINLEKAGTSKILKTSCSYDSSSEEEDFVGFAEEFSHNLAGYKSTEKIKDVTVPKSEVEPVLSDSDDEPFIGFHEDEVVSRPPALEPPNGSVTEIDDCSEKVMCKADKGSIADAKLQNEQEEEERRVKCLQNLLQFSQLYAEFLTRRKVDENKYFKKNTNSKAQTHESANRTKHNTQNNVGDARKDQSSASYDPSTYQHPVLFEGGTLRDYQIEGVEWLMKLYINGINGILADEMGLGKTVQVIALFCQLIEKKVTGPYLILGPLSTLPNWALEFERFAPKVPVVLYHGNAEERQRLAPKLKTRTEVLGNQVLPVVLTSFQVPLHDKRILKAGSWKYMVVDEGHRLKNYECKLFRELSAYSSVNRLLLTGTPLQNNLPELWSLLNFLMPEVFSTLHGFEGWLSATDMNSGNAKKIVQLEKENHVVSTLHEVLAPFVLRRTKSEVAINLPAKKELLVYCPLTPTQEQLYRATLERNAHLHSQNAENTVVDTEAPRPKRKSSFYKVNYNFNVDYDEEEKLLEKRLESKYGSPTASSEDEDPSQYFCTSSSNNIPMQLRKIVNHPYLVNWPLERDTWQPRVDEDLVNEAGKLKVLDTILPLLHQREHRVVIFSTFCIMLDVLEKYMMLRNYSYLRLDGSTPLEERKNLISKYNSQREIFIFLVSTRAGGLGINLTGADTVVIYDSDWNPQVDLQAQDRCHRIGQTRPVVVYRLVTADTIDQQIVDCAETKRKLEKMVIGKGNFRPSTVGIYKKISPEELLELLNSREHQGVFCSQEHVFTDEQLEALLDRSNMNGYTESKTAGLFKLVT